jgi:hypothetical protein|tara:strand:- start:827 stop:1177 length:351 start_codon:yes stop_codon:yes gene_type:complete
MAKEEIKFNKQVYGKVSYPKIINTEFEELVSVEETPVLLEDQIDVPEFFEEYDRLFFQIPKRGNLGTHEEIIKRSSSYIGISGQSSEINALVEEINDLRIQLLAAQQEIVNLSSNV